MASIYNKKKPRETHEGHEERFDPEANIRYVKFLKLLRKLALYKISYEGESLYWEYIEQLEDEREAV